MNAAVMWDDTNDGPRNISGNSKEYSLEKKWATSEVLQRWSPRAEKGIREENGKKKTKDIFTGGNENSLFDTAEHGGETKNERTNITNSLSSLPNKKTTSRTVKTKSQWINKLMCRNCCACCGKTVGGFMTEMTRYNEKALLQIREGIKNQRELEAKISHLEAALALCKKMNDTLKADKNGKVIQLDKGKISRSPRTKITVGEEQNVFPCPRTPGNTPIAYEWPKDPQTNCNENSTSTILKGKASAKHKTSQKRHDIVNPKKIKSDADKNTSTRALNHQPKHLSRRGRFGHQFDYIVTEFTDSDMKNHISENPNCRERVLSPVFGSLGKILPSHNGTLRQDYKNVEQTEASDINICSVSSNTSASMRNTKPKLKGIPNAQLSIENDLRYTKDSTASKLGRAVVFSLPIARDENAFSMREISPTKQICVPESCDQDNNVPTPDKNVTTKNNTGNCQIENEIGIGVYQGRGSGVSCSTGKPDTPQSLPEINLPSDVLANSTRTNGIEGKASEKRFSSNSVNIYDDETQMDDFVVSLLGDGEPVSCKYWSQNLTSYINSQGNPEILTNETSGKQKSLPAISQEVENLLCFEHSGARHPKAFVRGGLHVQSTCDGQAKSPHCRHIHEINETEAKSSGEILVCPQKTEDLVHSDSIMRNHSKMCLPNKCSSANDIHCHGDPGPSQEAKCLRSYPSTKVPPDVCTEQHTDTTHHDNSTIMESTGNSVLVANNVPDSNCSKDSSVQFVHVLQNSQVQPKGKIVDTLQVLLPDESPGDANRPRNKQNDMTTKFDVSVPCMHSDKKTSPKKKRKERKNKILESSVKNYIPNNCEKTRYLQRSESLKNHTSSDKSINAERTDSNEYIYAISFDANKVLSISNTSLSNNNDSFSGSSEDSLNESVLSIASDDHDTTENIDRAKALKRINHSANEFRNSGANLKVPDERDDMCLQWRSSPLDLEGTIFKDRDSTVKKKKKKPVSKSATSVSVASREGTENKLDRCEATMIDNQKHSEDRENECQSGQKNSTHSIGPDSLRFFQQWRRGSPRRRENKYQLHDMIKSADFYKHLTVNSNRLRQPRPDTFGTEERFEPSRTVFQGDEFLSDSMTRISPGRLRKFEHCDTEKIILGTANSSNQETPNKVEFSYERSSESLRTRSNSNISNRIKDHTSSKSSDLRHNENKTVGDKAIPSFHHAQECITPSIQINTPRVYDHKTREALLRWRAERQASSHHPSELLHAIGTKPAFQDSERENALRRAPREIIMKNTRNGLGGPTEKSSSDTEHISKASDRINDESEYSQREESSKKAERVSASSNIHIHQRLAALSIFECSRSENKINQNADTTSQADKETKITNRSIYRSSEIDTRLNALQQFLKDAKTRGIIA